VAIPSTIPILGIPWDDILFVILAGTMLASGLAVVVMRDIIRCGLAMMACFGALALIYAMAGAPLVGAAQVLVYIGAISVLVLFAIMLTQTKSGPGSLVFQTQAWPAAIASAILALLIAVVVASTDWPEAATRIPTSAVDLAHTLFSDYVLAFEVVSVLLLAAVIGGVFLAKRERGGND
jgi:NADH-quinone oxidoreductase subunit J